MRRTIGRALWVVLPACSQAGPATEVSPVTALAPPDSGPVAYGPPAEPPLTFPEQHRELLIPSRTTVQTLTYHKGSGARRMRKAQHIEVINDK